MRARSSILVGLMLACAACADDDSGGTDAGPQDSGPGAWETDFDAFELGWFLSIWGPSGSDLYAVGGSPDAGLIMHFDGTDWSNLPIGIDVPLLNWVYGFGANDITFVGAGGTVLHYDGTTFTAQPTPTDQDLWGVWGAAPDDLWTVGGNGRQEDQATILHFDGTAWTEATLPPIQRASVGAFFKVWGSARDDVYAVGQRGIVMHFDGSAWEELFVGASDDLISVWGTGPDRVVMVGGRANGQIVTYDGTDFRHMSLSPSPGLNGVWMRTRDQVHVGGDLGFAATVDFETLEETAETVDSFLVLHALFGDSNGILHAVGGSLNGIDPPHRGLALKRTLGGAE